MSSSPTDQVVSQLLPWLRDKRKKCVLEIMRCLGCVPLVFLPACGGTTVCEQMGIEIGDRISVNLAGVSESQSGFVAEMSGNLIRLEGPSATWINLEFATRVWVDNSDSW